jgi:hypothetical protein
MALHRTAGSCAGGPFHCVPGIGGAEVLYPACWRRGIRNSAAQWRRSIHRIASKGPRGVSVRYRDFLRRFLPRWLGLTKIAIAIEKKVAKQSSAYHL